MTKAEKKIIRQLELVVVETKGFNAYHEKRLCWIIDALYRLRLHGVNIAQEAIDKLT